MKTRTLSIGLGATITVLLTGLIHLQSDRASHLDPIFVAGEARESNIRQREVLKDVKLSDIDPGLRRSIGLPNSVGGALVVNVPTATPAYRAGLRAGQIIQVINRVPITSADQAAQELKKVLSPTVFLKVWSLNGSRWLMINESAS